MTPETIFQLCSGIALLGWLTLLFLSPFILEVDKLVIGTAITLLAIIYAWLIFGHFDFSATGKFGTLAGVMELFTDKALVTAGWVHYLAFDLLTGTWIKRNGSKHHIAHVLLIPCLLLTFMLGPVGLLLFLIIRWLKTRHYFAENY
jgi:heme A synthase